MKVQQVVVVQVQQELLKLMEAVPQELMEEMEQT